MISLADRLIEEEIKKKKRAIKDPLEKYLDPFFPAQNDFVADPSRFLAAQCSRRAGKTNGLAIRFLHAMETHPGALCPYIALTRESARNIMWPAMQEQDTKFRVGCEFTESNLTVTHPNGARLQMFGADMKNFIRRLKGIKTPAAAIDEAQEFGSHIVSLVDDVLSPTLTDYDDSWIALTGTPGPIPLGYFFEVTEQQKYGYSLHKWTLFDNPYLPNARAFVEELKNKRGWTDQHPTYLREWCNKWVRDLQSLLIQYNEGRCHFEKLPPSKWEYIIGIDIGFEDADAIAVLAWSGSQPATYLVEERINRKQGLTELVASIRELQQKYNASKLVIDEGGLGKKLAEEMRRRHHIPVQAADKARKMETVEFLNDAMRVGVFKAKKDSQFVKDSYLVQIDYDKSTPDRLVVKKSFHSDIIDGVLYAFKESPAFTYRRPKDKPKYRTKQWYEQEVSDMEQAAEEHFRKEEEDHKAWGAI